MPLQWLRGTRSARVATATVGAFFAVSVGLYTASHILPYIHGFVEAIKAQRSRVQKLNDAIAAGNGKNDRVQDTNRAQESSIEDFVGPCEAKEAEKGNPRQHRKEPDKIVKQSVARELRQEAEIIELKQNSQTVEDKARSLDAALTDPGFFPTKRETEVTRQDKAFVEFKESNSLLEEENKELRSDILYLAEEHEKDLAAVQSRFLTEYGLVEDNMEALREANQVLRSDIAQAYANVEGLKMQMEEAAEAADGVRREMMEKLEDEQAEFNKLEDDRDYLQEDKDALLKEVECLKKTRDALHREQGELAKRLSRLGDRNVELEQNLTERSQRLTLITKEKTELESKIKESTGAKERPKDATRPEKAGALEIHKGILEPHALRTVRDEIEGEDKAFNSGTPLEDEERTWEEQGICDHGVEVDEQAGAVPSDTGSVNDMRPLYEHCPSENKFLIEFHDKVEEILRVLGEGKGGGTASCNKSTLFTLVGDLYDLLYQKSLTGEDDSHGDDTLHDTPGQSTIDLADGKPTSDDELSLEEHGDIWKQGLQRSSSLSDVSGEDHTSQQTFRLDHHEPNRTPAASDLTPVKAQEMSSGEPQCPSTKPKPSRWRKLSLRSKTFLGGLRGSPTSSERGER